MGLWRVDRATDARSGFDGQGRSEEIGLNSIGVTTRVRINRTSFLAFLSDEGLPRSRLKEVLATVQVPSTRAGVGGGEMNQETGTERYERLLTRCQNLEPIPTAVAHPCDETSLSGAVEAARKGIIAPILVGPVAKIAATARSPALISVAFKSWMFLTAGHRQQSRSSWHGKARSSC